MSVGFDIQGLRHLEGKLHKLPDQVQKRIVRAALKREAVKARARIVDNIERLDLIDRGIMRDAYAQTNVIQQSRSKGILRYGPTNPTRDKLGIDPNDKHYYPYAVEFGHEFAPPKPFIRPSIDGNRQQIVEDIAGYIGPRIEKLAK